MEIKKIYCGYLLLFFLLTGYADVRAGSNELLMSAAIPGLGQLYNGNRVKGLSLIAAGAISLHLFLNQVSVYNGYCRQTSDLKKEYGIVAGSSYDERMLIKQGDWQQAYDDAVSAKKLIVPYLAVYGLVWSAGMADLLLWGKDDTQKSSSSNTGGQYEQGIHYGLLTVDSVPVIAMHIPIR